MERTVSSGRTLYAGIGLVFALLLGGYFVYKITGVVLAFLLTILLSIILSAPVNYLHRRGLSRTWGMLAVLAAFALGLWIFGLAVVPAMVPHDVRNAGAGPLRVLGFFAAAAVVSTFRDPPGPGAPQIFVHGASIELAGSPAAASGRGAVDHGRHP